MCDKINEINTSKTSPYRVAIVDSNLYSRNWAAQLLMRDWRTRVVSELNDLKEVQDFEENQPGRIDALCINLNSENEITSFIQMISSCEPAKKGHVVILLTEPNREIINALFSNQVSAVLVRDEIEDSLAWAVVNACRGNMVITPAIEKWIIKNKQTINNKLLVLSGNQIKEFLSPAEIRNARLAFFMSMSRPNMADELQIGVNSNFTMISRLYEHLGVNDLINGNDWIGIYEENDPILNTQLQIMRQDPVDKKAKGLKETLAFHIASKPSQHFLGHEN